MSRPVALWGLLMCALAAIGVTVFAGDWRFAALMFGIGAWMVVLGAFLLGSGLGDPPAPGPLALPDLSPPSAAAAAGVVLVLLGGTWGAWLAYIGAGVLLIGLGGLGREWRAQRRAVALRERARNAGSRP